MYKFAFKVFSIALAIFFMNHSAFAINPEFKNSLMKIELTKVAEGDYALNLYTKSKFVEPIKVIKKSDLNYYVLLPETKNESTRTTTNGTDIRSVSTNVYAYAGQDVNNGYVKINIDTTKPINFKINIKSSIAAATITPKIAQAVLDEKDQAKPEAKKEAKVQKKNSNFIISKKNEPAKKEIAKKEIKRETKEAPIVENPPLRIEDVIQQEVEKYREETLLEIDEELANIEAQYGDKEVLPIDELNDIERIANGEKKKSFIAKKFDILNNKISNKLSQYGIESSGFSFFISLLALIFVFGFLIFVRKDKKNLRLKTKAELRESICCEKTNDNSFETKNDGQYFVFDKNIKQTGFCDPATSAIKRNYELSSYEPELKNKYNRNAQFEKKAKSEYDIIQKILKEDKIIDLPNGTFEQQVRTAQLKPQNVCKKEETITKKQEIKAPENKAVQIPKKEIKKEIIKENQEPVVLSNIEIAPQRGFMLVSYNGNINLLGYIFDDVFALYNFKRPKLEKYDIRYRLSEKDDKIARFIVKVADVKMLIATDNTSMKLEVIL